MSVAGNIRNAVASLATNERAFRDRLTPATALIELKRFNENQRIRAAARGIATPVERFEWLLNSFQYAASTVDPSDILDMAVFLNECPVFRNVAPHFFGSTAWNLVVCRLLVRCDPEERPSLLRILEERDYLQAVAREGVIGAWVFYRLVPEALNFDQSTVLLRESPSFAIIAKQEPFIEETLTTYPAYGSLVISRP